MKAIVLFAGLAILVIALSGCTIPTQELLNKPVEEYALALADVDAGFKEHPDSKKYITLADLSTNYPQLVTSGFQQGYIMTFYKGVSPSDSNLSGIDHSLYKFNTIEGATQFFAIARDESEKIAQGDENAKVLSIPFKGDEIFAVQIEFPGGTFYPIVFRTKNITHVIGVVDTKNIFSEQTISNYVDKIVEKTKK